MLRDDSIGAAVDPDELVSPRPDDELPSGDLPAADAGAAWDTAWSNDPGSGFAAFDSTTGPVEADRWSDGSESGSSWGSPADSSSPVESGTGWDIAPAPGGQEPGSSDSSGSWENAPDPWAATQGDDVAPTAADESDSGSLVPVEGAEGLWAPGPAPATSEVGSGEGAASEDTWGSTGLDPVDWYPEPGSPSSADTPEDPDASWAVPSGGGVAHGTADDRSSGTDGAGSAGDGGQADFDAAPFDPGAIFREPEPGEASAFGQDLEPVGDPGELAVQWEPAAPDAWDAPVEPKGRPKGQAVLSREARMLVMGLILIIMVGGAALWLQESEEGPPSEWAPNVQEVATWVAKTRKLDFAHKVPVQTLSPDEFDALVDHAARPEKDQVRQQLVDEVAAWRALGAVQGNPETSMEWVAAQRPGLGAFYDLDTGKLSLRSGTEMDQLAPGLAGSLSVALDDQYGDLASLQSSGIAENPLFDVVNGTAALMRRDYSDSRSSGGDRSVDELQQLPGSDDADEDLEFLNVKPILQVGLGDGFAQFIRAYQGVEEGNDLVTDPPASSQQVMFPLTYISGRGPLGVEEPIVPEGADKLDEGSLGASTWYLLLAGHVADGDDLGDVFDFANRWAGDHYVSYRKENGQVCVTDVLRGADESDARVLASVLGEWRDAIPENRIEIDAPTGLDITVTGCDPGADADQSLGGSYGYSVLRALVRSHLAAGYYAAGAEVDNGPNPPIFTPDVAWCMADNAVEKSPALRLWHLAKQNGAEYEEVTLQAGRDCGSHLVDQLFADRED